MNAEEILRELVAVPTNSSASNLPLLEWVARFAGARGWRAELFPCTDENGMAKASLIARPLGADGYEEPIHLAFVGDTGAAPLFAATTSSPKLSEGSAGEFDTGSFVAKNSLACFLAAIDRLPASAIRSDVALVLTADGETSSTGMDRLLAATHLRIGSAIVSRPTSLHPGIASKGYGLARLTINGIEAPSADPREGLSAISLAANFIGRIEGLGKKFALGADSATATDPLFDPPYTTVNVGRIEGGSTKPVVADKCSLLVEWRPIPADPPRALLAELEWLADGLHSEEPRARIHVEQVRAEKGIAPSATNPLLDRLKVLLVPHRAPVGVSFCAQASRLAHVADEVVVIGPGDMRTVHSELDRVPISELEEWSRVLGLLLTAA
jgi:acetylornithine deacetylase